MVKKCTCKHEEQDKMYGKGRRVHTNGDTNDKSKGKKKCTVCGKEA